jgi:predicted amidohydrolase
VARAGELVRHAADEGANLVVLPEKWNVIDHDGLQATRAESLDGPSLTAARGWARGLGVTLVAGSISERQSDPGRAANTSVVIGPDGRTLATYRKVHLFDVRVGDHVYRESAGTIPGREIVVAPAAGHRIGLSICYDLRFPELFRTLADHGADIITLPAAFTAVTGAAHWEVLVRARAIENQVFMLAAGQVGRHTTGTDSYGHSMIVDPWGTILARVERGEGVAVADLDFASQADLRRRMPVHRHRRLDVAQDVRTFPAASDPSVPPGV